VDRNKLLESLNVVSHAVPASPSQAILQCVLIKAGESLRVYANDLELGIESADIEAEIAETGSVAIEARIFLDIVRKMPMGPMRITTDDQNMTLIKGGRSEFKVVGQPGDQFPLPAKMDSDDGFSLNAGEFKEMIRQTIISVAVDQTKAVLTGELIQIKDGKIHLVSVDGFRISYRQSKDSGIDPAVKKSVVAPAKILTELMRILPSDGETKITFYLKESNIMFQTDKYTLISRLLDGEFIRYNQIFTEDCDTRVEIDRQELLLCVDRASLLMRENKNTPVKLSIGQDTIVITSNTESGSAYDECAAKIDGSPLDIAFNPKYLLDCLRVIENETVILSFTGALSPCIIKAADNEFYKYLVLPLRIR